MPKVNAAPGVYQRKLAEVGWGNAKFLAATIQLFIYHKYTMRL